MEQACGHLLIGSVNGDEPLERVVVVLDVVDVVGEGFDPWTGFPHGRSFTCDPAAFGGSRAATYVVSALPDDVVDRRAIPLPVGLAIGGLLAGGMLLLRDRRRRFDMRPNDVGQLRA